MYTFDSPRARHLLCKSWPLGIHRPQPKSPVFTLDLLKAQWRDLYDRIYSNVDCNMSWAIPPLVGLRKDWWKTDEVCFGGIHSPLERFVKFCSHRVQLHALLLSSTKNNMYLDNTDHLDSCREGETERRG